MQIVLLLASLFLNGVNIDGIRSQSFEKCRTIKVDERGDVHLDCPGYQVEAPAVPASAPAAVATSGLVPTSISKHYWLVTEQSQFGAAQYDLDVFVNSKWIRKVKSGEAQIVLEITKYLTPGPNKVLFAAIKHLEEGRQSTSPSVWVKVIVGEGESGGSNVMIDNPLLECKRTAAEIDNVNEEFTIQAR